MCLSLPFTLIKSEFRMRGSGNFQQTDISRECRRLNSERHVIYTLTNDRVEEFMQKLHLEKTYHQEGTRIRNENGWRNWGPPEDGGTARY